MSSAATLLIPKDGELEGKTNQKQSRNVLNHREYITPQKPFKELYPDMGFLSRPDQYRYLGQWYVLLF